MSEATDPGVGRRDFVELYGLYSDEQRAAAEEVANRIREADLRTVRVVIVDQHGQPRAKFLSPDAAIAAMRNGLDFSGAIYSLDTANTVFPPPFVAGGGFGIEEFTGFPDVVIVPDPTTFQVLPWASSTGWMLSDAYFNTGRPLPLDPRRLLRRQLERLDERSLTYLSGLEVEFYITRRVGSRIAPDATTQPAATPEVEPFQLGYQYLSEVRLDSVNDTLTAIRDGLAGVGLLPRAMEDEWGPGQMEFSLSPRPGLGTADAMVLFRSAVKQLCGRLGLHASFMCKPQLPNFFASGWHLHMSLLDSDGENAFTSPSDPLSPLGLQYVAGVLDNATALAAFANPTLNGYTRFQPYSFAPDRITWAIENRGSMVRVQGGPGDPGTHLEDRLGEPAANPYLYLAADLAAGLDGVERGLEPPPRIEADPYAAEAPALPTSIDEALDALDKNSVFRQQFGTEFVDYYLMMKRAESARHKAVVEAADDPDAASAAWQMREYFEFY